MQQYSTNPNQPGHDVEIEKGKAGTQQQTPSKIALDVKQDRSKSNENFTKIHQNADKPIVQPDSAVGQKRPKSNLDQVAPSNKFLDLNNVN